MEYRVGVAWQLPVAAQSRPVRRCCPVQPSRSAARYRGCRPLVRCRRFLLVVRAVDNCIEHDLPEPESVVASAVSDRTDTDGVQVAAPDAPRMNLVTSVSSPAKVDELLDPGVVLQVVQEAPGRIRPPAVVQQDAVPVQPTMLEILHADVFPDAPAPEDVFSSLQDGIHQVLPAIRDRFSLRRWAMISAVL